MPTTKRSGAFLSTTVNGATADVTGSGVICMAAFVDGMHYAHRCQEVGRAGDDHWFDAGDQGSKTASVRASAATA